MRYRRSVLRCIAGAIPDGRRLYVARLDMAFVSEQAFQDVWRQLQAWEVPGANHLPGRITLEDMSLLVKPLPEPKRRKR